MKKIIFLFGFTLVLFSCTTTEENPQPESTKDIYVGGFETNSSGIKVAKIWKNSQETILGDGVKHSEIKAMQIVNTDIYAVGNQMDSEGKNKATLWKNGVKTALTTGNQTSFANTLFVINSDVYVGGGEMTLSGNFIAKIWKNGVELVLTNGATNTAVTDIFVVGTDIYACGGGINSLGVYQSRVWKNGQEIIDINNNNQTIAKSIYVFNNKVYVSGIQDDNTGQSKAVYWKNSDRIIIGPGTAQDIIVEDINNENIFIALNEINAKIYTNGIITSINDIASSGYALFKLGNEVYVAGEEFVNGSSNTKAKYWVNGSGKELTSGTTEAQLNTIFVKNN